MEKIFTVALDSPEIVVAICGANDVNIKLFEECFGVPIVTRGNEIVLMSDDETLTSQFEKVVKYIAKAPELHTPDSADFISSALKNFSDNEKESLNVSGIHIPRSSKAVYPKNPRQAEFIQAIQTHDLTFGIGPAGTGKTYIATALALQMLLEKRVQKIVLTRPVVEAGENLGFLPGDLIQKITPYLRPLYDIIEHLLPPFQFRRLEEEGLFEVAPLAYMRGRTLFRSVVILDEAQNTSAEQMKMFLTRLGPDSKMIITGDPGQSDIQNGKTSGLSHAVSLLRPIKDIAIVTFTSKDVVRHSLVQKIINAYDEAGAKNTEKNIDKSGSNGI